MKIPFQGVTSRANLSFSTWKSGSENVAALSSEMPIAGSLPTVCKGMSLIDDVRVWVRPSASMTTTWSVSFGFFCLASVLLAAGVNLSVTSWLPPWGIVAVALA